MVAEILTARLDNIVTTASPLTDEEILEKIIVEEIEADDGLDDALDKKVAIPDEREVELVLDILHKFSVSVRKEDRECKI